jgi:hypothetical protein
MSGGVAMLRQSIFAGACPDREWLPLRRENAIIQESFRVPFRFLPSESALTFRQYGGQMSHIPDLKQLQRDR